MSAPVVASGSGRGAEDEGGDAAPSQKQLEELSKLVAELQVEMRGGGKKGRKKDKKRRGSRERRRRRKGSSSSASSRGRRGKSRSSSSRSSRRRRRSGSSGSSSEFIRWKTKGRNKRVAAGKLSRLDVEKFKTGRSALLGFAQKHPGALTAHFLQLVRMKMRGAAGVVKETKQLRDVDVSSYVSTGSMGLTELRDIREAATLGAVLDAVNRSEVSTALDIIVMRLQALQAAKRKGGSWDKASKVELIPEPGADMMAAGVSGLVS